MLGDARIGAGTRDPGGGAIRRDADAAPSGVLHESAVTAALHLPPPVTAADLEAAIGEYAAGLLALGITGAHDPGGLDTPDLGAGAITSLAGRGIAPDPRASVGPTAGPGVRRRERTPNR